MLGILTSLGGSLLSGIFGIVDQVVEDKDKALEIKAAINSKYMEYQSQLLESATKILTTEMTGSWLQRSWRPLTMLTFVALVVARWLGFAAPGMSEAEYLSVYDLIKIGLGGYVVGRSAEKIVPAVVEAMKDK